MKRFYTEAEVRQVPGGFAVLLDTRSVRTQGGNAQLVPTRALADLLAREWNAQGETLDPSRFPHRDRADYAIDVVRHAPAAVIAKLLGYAETDTLSYRADPDEALYRRQREVWDPILTRFETREGVSMTRTSGIVHRPLGEDTRTTLETRLAGLDPFTLAALETVTALSASLAIGLSALEPGSDREELWNAANLEEDWQTEQWGKDAEATERRAARREQFLSAAKFVDAVATSSAR